MRLREEFPYFWSTLFLLSIRDTTLKIVQALSLDESRLARVYAYTRMEISIRV